MIRETSTQEEEDTFIEISEIDGTKVDIIARKTQVTIADIVDLFIYVMFVDKLP